ncbi:hypothetical protein [Nocardia amikacinitolerans]|uniref:hypothetical protein n=1 Tax=Nocardia amikacinitolerans TaxID=756689 RepID=UPI0020A2F190|nr:hypothetical protein [Nocardia amikacinitolerans]
MKRWLPFGRKASAGVESALNRAERDGTEADDIELGPDGRPDRRGPAGFEAPEFPMEPNAAGGQGKPPNKPPVPAPSPDEPNEGERRPAARREHLFEFEGLTFRLDLTADGAGAWNPVLRQENSPAQESETAPQATNPKEVEAPHAAQKPPGSIDKPKSKFLANTVYRKGFQGYNPKYPSGSSVDGAGQSVLGYSAGLPLTKDSPQGEVLQIKFNPARILKEGVTMWKAREYVPILNRLTSRVPDRAAEFQPIRNMDGTEYRPWVDDASPEAVRKEHGVDIDEMRRRDDAAQQANPPESQEVRNELPQPEPQLPTAGAEATGAFADLLNELAGAVDQRRELADRLVAAARAMGLRLGPGLDGEAALQAVRVLQYQQARRIGALAGLAESAVRYDAENRHIPFSQEVSFFDNDPMTRFLREIVHADDRPTTMLDWQGVNNGGEPGRDWGDLSYTDQPGIDQGKPGYFVNALRRDQIKDERAVWAQLLQVDLHYLDSHPRGALADALANVHARTADIARFAELANEFVRVDGNADELTRLVTDLALRSSIVSDGGFLIPDADGLGLLPGIDGGPLRLMVVDGHLDHAHVLASALRAHPNIAEVVNDGQVDVVFRVAEIATDGTILVSDSEPMRVRHVDELVDGRRLDMTFLLDEDGQWRPVVEIAPTTESESPRPKPDLERLSRNEIEAARKELAHRLGVPESDLDDPRRLSDRMEQIRAENKIRASQIEALIDYGRTAWDIDDFHTIGDARAQLADRLKLEPGELTPERLAKAFVLDKIGSARGHQAVEDLIEYAALMRGIDADVVDAARDRLADRLGIGRRRGRFPRDLFPRNYNNDEKKYRPDRTGTDPKRLNKAIAKLARRPAERENLIDALAEYYRTINRLDPFDPVSRGADAVDPRLADVEFPVHPKAVAHLLDMIGDLESLAEALRSARVLDGFGMLGANNSAPDPRPTPNPDFTRTVGVDLPEPIQPTDTDAEKAAKAKRFEKVYEIYRDGKIDQKERLTPRQLAKVQAELRAEVHGRAADLDMLAALNDRAAELDRQARRPLEIARLLGERGAAGAQLDTARAEVEAATAHYRTAEPQERAAALDDLAAAARRQQAAAAELARVDAALAATRPTEPPALPLAAHGAVANQGEGSSAPTRPEPAADGGGRKPPRGPLAPPTPDPEEPGRRPDVEIARRVTQRLAAENAAAVRELAAADAARNAAMVGLPVTLDQLGPAPEQVANTVDRLTRAHPEQAARIAELREAALRYLAAESEVAVLDEALARAMQREALAEEGAGRIDDTVGVVAGEPPRIVVVGWHSPGDVRAQLETERPLLRPLLARPGVVVTHIEIVVLDDGRITHRRTDFTPDRPPAPEPRDAGERQSPRQRAEERYQRALRDAHRQIGHTPQGDPRTTVWPGGAQPEASSDPVAGSDDPTVDLGREDPRTTVWPGGAQPEASSDPVAGSDDPTVDLGQREDPRTRVWPGGGEPGHDPSGGLGNDPSGGSDGAGSQPEPYRPKHRGRPADEAQHQAETYEPKHRGRPADESATEPDAHQPKHRGVPADESGVQPERIGGQLPAVPETDPMPAEAREALDRLRAERAEAVARRAEWDDIRRMRAEALDPADASTVDALARAARQFDDADSVVAELDAEIAELELANTPEGVYRQLMRERAVLAREREFWRAKRDDRYSRFSDLPLPFGDAAQALNQSNLARTLEHLEASVAGTRNIAGTGDEAGYVAREELDPGEIARRREQIFKLHDAALRYNRVQAALAEVDRRIAALGRVGIGEPQPLSRQVRAEVDRLAGERAREVLESKPWRQMRADIAARLRVNESDLGPDAAALDSALEEVAGRTVRADQLAERVRNLDLLREAATRVNEADHRIARIQGRIAELAGAGRDFLAAEGARQVTERVGFVDGDPQRIIVIAPRGTLDAPRADHDAALLDAIQRDSRVARAMLARETTIEYRELVAELDQPVTTRRLRSPSREYMTLGPDDAPVLRRVRWQSGERDSSTWHEVNPERPEWTTNRKGPTTPKEFKERDLPEGVSGWATNPFQAAVVDPFVDNGSGINKGLLPAIPGGAPTYPGPTYELPFADVFYHFMRLTLEPAKLFGFTWYNDSAHPGRISPGFKGHPWFRKKGADVQPMAREPERAEREHAPGELVGYERKQADEQRAWQRVQDWASEQYRLFRKSDGDIDRITANLAARPEFEGAAREVRAAEIVDRIASVVEDYMSARIEVTTRTSDDPGPDLSAVVADLTGTLRSEQPGDAARLVDDIREALLGLKPDRAAISAEVAVRLDNSVKAFSREQIAQIKHHYMEAVYRRALPVDGSPAHVRLDEVADVAEAWLRLIGDEARPEDVLMLQDALAESNFLRANDYASWRDANQYAIRIGFDWDSVRPPLTGWRKGIRYAPAPLPTDAPLPPRPDTDDDGPDPLQPGPGPSSPPSLPPGQSPGQLPQAPSPDDVATVPLGSPIGADDPTIPLPGPDDVDDPTVPLSGAIGADDPTVPLVGPDGADDPTVPLSGVIGPDDPTVPLPNPESAEERGTNQDPTTSIGDDPTIDLRRGAEGSEQDGRPETAGDRYEIDNPQFGARLRYGFENWDAVVDALAPHERAVLERIASLNVEGSGFRAAIEAALRGDAELTPELAAAVDILDDVLARFRLPDTAVMTYVRPENSLDMSGDVIGSLHQLTEFPQLALGETPPIYGGRFHLELTVPAGTPALFMNRFLPSGMPVPVMMLGRGLHMRVDTVRSLGNDGHWLIRATVVPEADAPAEAAGDRSPGNAPVSSSAPESAVHQPDSRTTDEVAAVSPPEPDAGGGGKKPPQVPPLTAPEPNDPADDSESQPLRLSPPEPVGEDPGVPPLRLTPPDQDPDPYSEPAPRAIQPPDQPPRDEWSRRDVAEIVRVLSERHGVDLFGERRAMQVLRFDLPHLDPEVLREYARAIDDLLTKYPGTPVAILDILTVQNHRSAFAATQWEHENGGARVVLDYQLATSSQLFWAAMSMDVAAGFKHPSMERRPAYSAVVHEIGHVLDYLSSEQTRATIEDVLRRRYEEEFAAAHLAAGGEGYHTWIRQLSGYSFHDDGAFNPGEAIPEGFAEVELNGDAASEPARVIHETLVANARRALAEGAIPRPPSQLPSEPDAGGGGKKPPQQPPVGMPDPGEPNDDGSEKSAQQSDSSTDDDSGPDEDGDGAGRSARPEPTPDSDSSGGARLVPAEPSSQPDSAPTAPRSLSAREQAELDRLLAERAEAVSRREEWRDIRRMRAQNLPVDVDVDLTPDALVSTMDELRGKTMRVDEMPARLAAIDALERAAEHFADAESDIARLDDAIAALRDGTSQDEYEALVRERAAAVAEREFWRAKRNDRASRFADILPTLRGADDSLGADLAPTLEHLRNALVGERTIPGVGEDLSTQTPELVGEAELSRRRAQVFKLQRAAEEYERAAARVAEIDRRLGELGRSGTDVEPTLSHEARTEIDRLARERARQVLAVEPWRGMRDDLARRLRVNENELGPGQLDETLAEAAGRTIEASRVSEQARNLNLLREAAERVNAAEDAIDRIQARIAELTGAGREFLDAASARPIVPRVGLVEGDQPRIIVVAPRGGLDNPRALHDAALARALRENASVAHAMTRRDATVEFHEIIADRGEPVRYRRMAGPRREFLEITGPRPLDAGVLLVRWFDAAGRPHEVRPDRPTWRTNRDGGTVPKTFHPRDLPEGVSGWAVNPFQAALEDPFTDNGPGVNKDLLPAIPGGQPIETGPTYEVPFSGLFYHTMRLILETAKLSGFTWYADKNNPGRIRPGFKGHPFFRKKSAEVQPMAREWNVRDLFALPENERWYQASQTAEQRAWALVQRRAELEYERFRGDHSDIDRITDRLARNPAVEGAGRAVRAAELVALVDGLIEDHIEGLPTTRRPGDPGPDLSAAVDEITGHLRDEKTGDAERLVHFVYEELTRGTDVDRKELAGKVADRLDDSAPAFTRAEIAQIKHHLMNAEYLRTDWRTGVVVRQRLDAVVDVALAWQRLIDGDPNDADILMLQDALAESNFLIRNPTAFWNLANEHAVRIGFDWNSNRPPFTEWAKGAKYAPPSREPEHSRYALPPRRTDGGDSAPARPNEAAPSNQPGGEQPHAVDPRTVHWPGAPESASGSELGTGEHSPEASPSSGPVDPGTTRSQGDGENSRGAVDPRTVHWPGGPDTNADVVVDERSPEASEVRPVDPRTAHWPGGRAPESDQGGGGSMPKDVASSEVGPTDPRAKSRPESRSDSEAGEGQAHSDVPDRNGVGGQPPTALEGGSADAGVPQSMDGERSARPEGGDGLARPEGSEGPAQPEARAEADAGEDLSRPEGSARPKSESGQSRSAGVAQAEGGERSGSSEVQSRREERVDSEGGGEPSRSEGGAQAPGDVRSESGEGRPVEGERRSEEDERRPRLDGGAAAGLAAGSGAEEERDPRMPTPVAPFPPVPPLPQPPAPQPPVPPVPPQPPVPPKPPAPPVPPQPSVPPKPPEPPARPQPPVPPRPPVPPAPKPPVPPAPPEPPASPQPPKPPQLPPAPDWPRPPEFPPAPGWPTPPGDPALPEPPTRPGDPPVPQPPVPPVPPQPPVPPVSPRPPVPPVLPKPPVPPEPPAWPQPPKPPQLPPAPDWPRPPEFPPAPGWPTPPGGPGLPAPPTGPGGPSLPGMPSVPPQAPVPPEPPVQLQPPRLPDPPELPDLPVPPQFPPASGWPTSPGDPALPAPPTKPVDPPAPGMPTVPPVPPESPVSPQPPNQPQLPPAPSSPRPPEFPPAPGWPTSPGDPALPAPPTMPADPSVPGMPSAPPQPPGPPQSPVPPQVPVHPEPPVSPQTPVPPESPQPPRLPDPPELPDRPAPPQSPVSPQPPRLPDRPELPDLPTAPEFSPASGWPTPLGDPGSPEPPTRPGGPPVPGTPSVPPVPPQPPESPVSPQPPRLPDRPELPVSPTAPEFPPASGWPTSPGDPALPATPTRPGDPPGPGIPTSPDPSQGWMRPPGGTGLPGMPTLPDPSQGGVSSPNDPSVPGMPTLPDPSPGWVPRPGELGASTLPDPRSVGEPLAGGNGLSGGASGYSPAAPMLPPAVPPASAGRSWSSRAFPRAGFGSGPAESGQRAATGLVVRSHAGVGEFADFDPRTGALRGGGSGGGSVSGLYGFVGDLSVVFYREAGRLLLRAGDRVIDVDAQPIGVYWQQVDDRTNRFVLVDSGVVACDVHYRAVVPDLDFGLLIRDVLCDPDRRSRIFAA